VIYTLMDDFEHTVRRLFRRISGKAPPDAALAH
jgi:hypothetical protein